MCVCVVCCVLVMGVCVVIAVYEVLFDVFYDCMCGLHVML